MAEEERQFAKAEQAALEKSLKQQRQLDASSEGGRGGEGGVAGGERAREGW